MISIALGLLIGTVYGLFFVTQQRRALSFDQTSFTRHLTQSILFSFMRLIILSLSVLYVLHSSAINLILILISFIIPIFILFQWGPLLRTKRRED